MNDRVGHEDAVDLLSAYHEALKKMFGNHAPLGEDGLAVAAKHLLAQRICLALAGHARIEEEVFYPRVRQATDVDALMSETQRLQRPNKKSDSAATPEAA